MCIHQLSILISPYFRWIQTIDPPSWHNSGKVYHPVHFLLFVYVEIWRNNHLDLLSSSLLIPHRSTTLRPPNRRSLTYLLYLSSLLPYVMNIDLVSQKNSWICLDGSSWIFGEKVWHSWLEKKDWTTLVFLVVVDGSSEKLKEREIWKCI